jgi:hypothetical protein
MTANYLACHLSSVEFQWIEQGKGSKTDHFLAAQQLAASALGDHGNRYTMPAPPNLINPELLSYLPDIIKVSTQLPPRPVETQQNNCIWKLRMWTVILLIVITGVYWNTS